MQSVESIERYCGSIFWDQNLTWNTDSPDFTPCFQQTILVWAPSLFLWSFSIVDFCYIFKKKDAPIHWNWLNIFKFILNLILIILNIIDCVNALLHLKTLPLVRLTSSGLKVATFSLALLLLLGNKAIGNRTSGVLFIFWLLFTVFGAVRLRSEIRNLIQESCNLLTCYNYIVQYMLIVLLLILNCFAERVSKSQYDENLKYSPELFSSFLSKIVFAWFDPFVWKGYHQPIGMSDLWTINDSDKVQKLVPLFEMHWKNNRSKSPHKNISIIPPLWKLVWGITLFSFILLTLNDFLVLILPLLMKLLIGFIENSNEPQWRGIFYVILVLLVIIIQSVNLNQANKLLYTAEVRVRATLVAAIYRKALRISNTTRKGFTIGEIMNLMSVDVERLVDLLLYFNMFWSGPLQIGLSLYFLWQLLGVAALSGLAAMILLVPLNSYLITKIGKIQNVQMQEKDRRTKVMNEILNAMKILKLYAWEPSFQEQVLQIRQKEMGYLNRLTYIEALTSVVWSCVPFMVSLITFATFSFLNPNNVLDAKIIFVSLAYFNIMRRPINIFSHVFGVFIQAYVSLARINKFMNAQEIDEEDINHKLVERVPLIIENGYFKWDESFRLTNINLKIEEGTLTAVVGHVGSGKSSLISACLGEMIKICGHVNIHGRIAYVSQQAWIQNATLQDNILFGKPYNRSLYDKVIKACALQPDLAILPGGDQTEIGEKGINLSGGQKQRISLARAVYSRADIYFFDDPLSAVDSHVARHIFDQIIGPDGLLKGKTRILITHSISFLPQMDLILLMKDGMIIETGKFDELMEKKGIFNEFYIRYLQTQSNEKEDEELPKEPFTKELYDLQENTIDFESSFRKLAKSISVVDNVDNESVSESEPLLRPKLLTKRQTSYTEKLKAQENKIIEAEKIEVGSVQRKIYLIYFKAMGLLLFFFGVLANCVFEVFSIGGNYWLTIWANNKNSNSYIWYYLGVYGLFGLGQSLFTVLSDFLPIYGCRKAAQNLHLKMIKRIMRAPMTFFDTTPVGRILSRCAKDIDILDMQLPKNVSNILFDIAEVVAAFFVISFSTKEFLIVIIPIVIVYYVLQKFYTTISRQARRLESVYRSPIYSFFSESIAGTVTIRAFGDQQRFASQSDKKIEKHQMCFYPYLIQDCWLGIRLEFLGNLIIFFAALFAVLNRDSISPEMMGLTISYAFGITEYLGNLVRYLSRLETNIVAVERIDEYCNIEQEAPWCIPETTPSYDWPQKGEIQFDNYSVRYRPGLEFTLYGISFKINSKEKVGIVGRTGAGKSSLTLALFRILEAAQGVIVIDGKNIANLGLHNLRSQITIIPQDPVLFSGSLRRNLDPFKIYSDDEIWTVLEQAHLKKFVSEIHDGLEYEISEGGENLSVGQRQLVCLARALLRKTKILVLDEATASVDLDTDALIQETIKREFFDFTVITIAHRLTTILDSDRVLVLDKGRIIEYDAPKTLLEDTDSFFYKISKDAGIV